MSEPIYMILSVFAGFFLGAFFFGGLWWTIKKSVSSAQPALFFIVSMIVRTGIVLVGFYSVSCANWKRFLGCLVGFVIARIIVIRLTKRPPKKLKQSAKESN